MKTVCITRLFDCIAAAAAVALLTTFGSYAEGALNVTNGSFETPVVADVWAATGGDAGPNRVWYLVDTPPTGWTAIDPSSSMRIIAGTHFEADGTTPGTGLTPPGMSGVQFAILGSGFTRGDVSGTGTDLFQNIGTTAGLSNVTLLLDTSGRHDSALLPTDITIGIWQDTNANSIPDLALATLVIPAATETTAFVTKTVSALAVPSGTELYLRFQAANAPTSEFRQTLIDNARILVTSVPEPSSVVLLVVGAIVPGAFRFHRRKK